MSLPPAEEITLKRIAMNGHGAFGVLIYGGCGPEGSGVPFALTIERPWLDNQKRLSCIPSGSYVCRRVDSPKFGDTFEVTGVQGRSHILFHTGNVMEDSEGCILVGEQFETLGGRPAVLSSKKGFREFMERLEGVEAFTLHIINLY